MGSSRRSRPQAPRPGEGAFQLSVLGGASARQFDRLRPAVARLPWGTLAGASIPEALREDARRVWTQAAYSEHCAAAGMATAVLAMVRACVPIDLVSAASGFIHDELSHAELCARVVAELGGAPPLAYEAGQTHYALSEEVSPLAAACEQAIRVFCANESFALPLVRAEVKVGSAYPLVDAVVRLIGREEGPHAAFGWVLLDWAAPHLDAADLRFLRRVARDAVAGVESLLRGLDDSDEATLGWLSPRAFRRHARRALVAEVRAPLRARGLLV